MQTQTVNCHRCGAECVPQGCTTGYGTNAQGNKICFKCCGDDDLATMRQLKPITLYLTFEKDSPHALHASAVLTNWPASLRLLATVSKRRHNMAGHAWSVWAWFDGRRWYGVQADSMGQLVTMRPTKTTSKGI